MNSVIRSRAPLRLGLAGGGTDVSPFSDEEGGYVLNASIDLYAHCVLEPRDDNRVVFYASDREEFIELEATPILPDVEPLRLHRGVYNRVVRQFNGGRPLAFHLTTFADAPAGSGLGTSSTMVVCIVQAFSEWLNLGLGDYDIARIAYQIEREELGLAGGKQDQYAAAFGGVNFMEFGPGNHRVLINPLRVKDWIKNELEASTVLFYTGKSRESAKIIESQIKSVKESRSDPVLAMKVLKNDALLMKEAFLKGEFHKYADLLRSSWDAKKRLSASVSNPFLNSIYDSALSAGAVAGKISGAGGGGFFMFFVPPKNRLAVVRKLGAFNGDVINFHFTSTGVQSWTCTL